MKYQSVDLFKKHLESSFPNKLSNLFLVVVKDDYERLCIIDNISCYFPRDNAFSFLRFSAEKVSIKEFISNLDTPSLLGGVPIMILEEIDLYKRKDILELVDYIKQNRLNGFVVLASRDKKSILTLLSEVDKRGVVLDLASEKIWDKQKRLSNFIVEKCAQAKKSISSDAKETIISFMGTDMSAIENEIEKVIIYVGEKNIIEKKDVLLICSSITKISVWQIADKIIWGSSPFSVNLESEYCIDSTFFHSLIVAIRYNLQEGLKMSSAFEANQNISSLFPSLRPKVLHTRINVSKIIVRIFCIFIKKSIGNFFFTCYLICNCS